MPAGRRDERQPASPIEAEADHDMSFCEHCEGQRFDRARVLRALRQLRQDLRTTLGRRKADEAMALALKAVKTLDIPHLEIVDEVDEVVH
jgi:hypothetical protein